MGPAITILTVARVAPTSNLRMIQACPGVKELRLDDGGQRTADGQFRFQVTCPSLPAYLLLGRYAIK